MAMQVGRRYSDAIAEINVTPMADVMIVLLIIFMVAAPVIARAPVRLPEATHLTQRRGEKVEVVVRRDGSVAIDGATLATAEQLGAYLEARSPLPESMLVLVQADRDSTYADLARVLAACRSARVGEVALAAEARPGSPMP
jgi:biopolymer transport protein ExbD